jgi:hypothetical protein
MTEPMPGAGADAWAGLEDAFGRTDRVPALFVGVVDPDSAASKAAIDELFNTIWHQGTVYEVTPSTVRFLTDLVCDPTQSDRNRAFIAFLLAAIATADSYVLATDRTMRRPWWHDERSPTGQRDLALECRAAVAGQIDRLTGAFAGAPPALTCGLVVLTAATQADNPGKREPSSQRCRLPWMRDSRRPHSSHTHSPSRRRT